MKNNKLNAVIFTVFCLAVIAVAMPVATNAQDRMSSPPSWAQGTFYGTGPEGSQITLTLAQNGQVTALVNGNSNYGTYYRGSLYLNGNTSRVTRWNNGIRTTRNDNGEIVNYSRNGWNNGGNNGDWNGTGNMSSPPSWAQGTFYSTNGTNIQLTLAANGQVTVINSGQSYYGTYYRGQMTVNGDTSTVSRNGDGISTYNRSNGQTTHYSRNGWNNGGNNGGWNGTGNMSTPPSWAQGTFYSMDGSNIMLTLDGSGRATVVNGGQNFYGTFYRGNLLLNGDSSSVRRYGTGIQTYNRNTRQTTNYSRNNDGWNGNGNGNVSNPPTWAQGSFYSTNNDSIFLTINSNGQVTVANGGQTFYGTYYNGSITVNGDVSTVTKNGNGIRTYNQNNGQTTNYRRQ